MGKWTPRYTDDVLASKMKDMISGAIKRSKQESGEPVIRYEEFVKDLDTCDSFTATLIELLVKEVADRRTRHSDADRHLIMSRTADNLQSFAAPGRIYRGRPAARARSRLSAPDLSTAQNEWGIEPPITDLTDDDDVDYALSEGYMGLEGARINSNLYDAYRPYNSTSQARRSLPFIPSPTAIDRGDDDEPVQSTGPTSHPSPPHLIPSSSAGSTVAIPPPRRAHATSLIRQHSIHRATRTRTSDFNEFASHRRSTHRHHANQDYEAASNDTSNHPISGHSPVQNDPSALSSHSHPSTSGLRFHPRPIMWTGGLGEDAEPDQPLPSMDGASNLTHMESAGRPSTLYSLSRNLRGTGPSADGRLPTPRLRRGGLRPPESMMSHYELHPLSSGNAARFHLATSTRFFGADDDEQFNLDFGQWFNPQAGHSPMTITREEEPTSLPTPRSVSPSPEEVEREVLTERD